MEEQTPRLVLVQEEMRNTVEVVVEVIPQLRQTPQEVVLYTDLAEEDKEVVQLLQMQQ